MSTLILGLTLLIQAMPQALAVRPAMAPEIKAHAGLSMVQGPNGAGIMAGFDSRLSRFVNVDFGVIVSPLVIPYDETFDEPEKLADWYRLRHAIYTTPGLRIPHAQPEKFNWELMVRGGMAAVWTDNLAEHGSRAQDPVQLEIDVGGVAGLDLVLRKEKFGVRLSGRAFIVEPFFQDDFIDVLMVKFQGGAEVVYTF